MASRCSACVRARVASTPSSSFNLATVASGVGAAIRPQRRQLLRRRPRPGDPRRERPRRARAPPPTDEEQVPTPRAAIIAGASTQGVEDVDDVLAQRGHVERCGQRRRCDTTLLEECGPVAVQLRQQALHVVGHARPTVQEQHLWSGPRDVAHESPRRGEKAPHGCNSKAATDPLSRSADRRREPRALTECQRSDRRAAPPLEGLANHPHLAGRAGVQSCCVDL